MTNTMSPERPDSAQGKSTPPPQQMSVPGSPIALTPKHNAQSPISILLAVAQSTDDDLTSLSWLHEGDVLKDMNINTSPLSSTTSTPIKNGVPFLFDTSSNGDDSSISTASTYSTVNSPIPKYQNNGNNQNSRSHSIPFDPLIHVNSKPPYSFSSLIFMSIEDSKQKALPVKEIYAWILDHFPYFKNAPTGWKNSVRHNLSLNKCFQKVEKAPSLGKGSLWTVDPQYKPNLIQALNRSPFYPCSTLDPESYQQVIIAKPAANNNNNNNDKPIYRNPNLPNPDLFPFLSKKLAATDFENSQPRLKNEQIEESLDAVDAATVMLSLKNIARIDGKQDLQQVITNSPSQDHTYSATDSGDNEDDILDEDEELRCCRSQICRRIDFEDDEERKIKEGAETLLNLAGISTQKRLNSRFVKHEPQHKIRRYSNRKINYDEKTVAFKPRLLRTKRKECVSPKILFNNNNNEDEWVNHRKEIDVNHLR